MRRALGIVLAIALSAGSPKALAQSEASAAEDGVEAFLRYEGLDRLLAARLRERFATAGAGERIEIGRRLAGLYASLLRQASDGADRQAIEALARELIEAIPGDADDLRLALAEAGYSSIEDIAERHTLRLLDTGERERASESLRELTEVFSRIASSADNTLQRLETRDRSGSELSDAARSRLTEARSTRSRAGYYAGWSRYYLGVLTDSVSPLPEAISAFDRTLTGRDEAATLDRLNTGLLRFEHISKAAVGLALCRSRLGDHAEALAWIRVLDRSEDVPPTVRDQLLRRRITVYSSAGLWNDLLSSVRAARSLDEETVEILAWPDARLLAIESLEALGTNPSAGGGAVLDLAKVALSDLITAGRVEQVVGLAEMYGTLPLGTQGFIPLYVRGLQARADAVSMHEAVDGETSRPTKSPGVRDAYASAARLLEEAANEEVEQTNATERDRAGLLAGLSWYAAGEFRRAADRLGATAEATRSAEVGEESLWFAIAALKEAIEQTTASDEAKGLTARRAALAARFVAAYPRTERAAQLVLSGAGGEALSDEAIAAALRSTPPGSPLYLPSLRLLSDVLYRSFTGARGQARTEAAARYLGVVAGLLAAEVESLRSGDADAGVAALAQARRLLSVSLGAETADVDAARAGLRVIDQLEAGGVSLEGLTGELAYRRVQLAVAEGAWTRAVTLGSEARGIDERTGEAVERYLFRAAVGRWRRTGGELQGAADVVLIGDWLIARTGSAAEVLNDPETYRVHDDRSSAMATIALASGEGLEAAALAAELLADRPTPTAAALVRHARLLEASADRAAAATRWLELSARLPQGAKAWFEARYEAARLLSVADVDRCRAVLRQHAALYPALGPSPWAERFGELIRRVGGLDADGGAEG